MTMTRYVVIGTGAVGGTIAGRLARGGKDVVAVARGPHLEALQERGLHLRTPEFDDQVALHAVGGPEDLELREDDVLILATKTHQAQAALAQWSSAPVTIDGVTVSAGQALPVFTALNGVTSESIALRYFDRVFGVTVWLPAVHLEPGEVIARAVPVSGILHTSRFPAALTTEQDTALLHQVRDDFESSGLGIELPEDVMPWKYHKLLSNIGNAFQALLGGADDGKDLLQAARDEARQVLSDAGIEVTSDAEEKVQRAKSFTVAPVPGAPEQLGGSSWQSLARGTGTIETDYLNGEIAFIARQHGLHAPINAAITRLAHEAARTGAKPGDISAAELGEALGLAPAN